MECIPFSFACHDYSKYSADFQRQKLWFCRFSSRRFCQSFRSFFVHFYPLSLIAIFQPQNLPNQALHWHTLLFSAAGAFFRFFRNSDTPPPPVLVFEGANPPEIAFSVPKKRKGAPGRTGGLLARQLRSGTPGGMLNCLNLPCPFGQVGRFCGHAAGVSSVPSPLFTSPRVLPGSLVTPYGHSTSVGISSLSASTGWSASRKCSFSRAATASRSSA